MSSQDRIQKFMSTRFKSGEMIELQNAFVDVLEGNKQMRAALAEIKQYDEGGFCGRIAHCALKGIKS